MEWRGSNNLESRNHESEKKVASTYMFGPLIDAKASHPDTMLMSLEYLKKSLTDMGMTYAHISVDLHLYIVSCQIKWNDVDRHSKAWNHAYCSGLLWLHLKAHVWIGNRGSH